MRQFVLDEISKPDMGKVTEYLKKNAEASPIDGLFWVEMAGGLLDEGQASARGDQPFCFAVEVGESWVKVELLLRSRLNMRSEHTKYANARQIEYIIDYTSRMADTLNIMT